MTLLTKPTSKEPKMKTSQIIAAESKSAGIAMEAAEQKAIAKDQSLSLGMTKYTFDDNSVLAVRDVEFFGFDADDAGSIRAYSEWLGADIDEAESEEVERLLEALEE